MLERLLRGRKVDENPYYQQFPPTIDWVWMLVMGVFIGAFLAAIIFGDFQLSWVPGLWQQQFGPAVTPRLLVALFGGVVMGLGSRWAGGCTSGHGISGTLQLAASSWLAAICFFVSGIVTALLIYRI
jgi:uncharacterized membrane protein YedE/YeeE